MGRSELSPRQKTAVACRILAREGHAQTLAGQVTLRADNETFWTTNFSGGLKEATAGSLVRFDADMNVVEGSGMPNPAVRFHLWIYAQRPEVLSIVHTHPPYASALSMIGEPLRVAHMDTTMFHEDCAYLPQWPGVPLANEEGRIIAGALGAKSSILLAHHGLLAVGESIEKATYLAVAFESAAKLQMLARSAGDIKAIPAPLAAEAREFMTKPSIVDATFDYWARQVLQEYPPILD